MLTGSMYLGIGVYVFGYWSQFEVVRTEVTITGRKHAGSQHETRGDISSEIGFRTEHDCGCGRVAVTAGHYQYTGGAAKNTSIFKHK